MSLLGVQQEYVDSVYEDREQLTDERAFVNKLYQARICCQQRWWRSLSNLPAMHMCCRWRSTV